METKKCTKCGEVKPFSHFNKSKREKDNHNYWCKECSDEYRRTHKRRSKYHPSVRIKQNIVDNKRGYCIIIKGVMCQSIFSVCSKCKQFKSSKYFNKSTRNKSGIHSICKECNRKRRVIYDANNKEKKAKRMAKYRANNKEKIAKYIAIYSANNKEKIAKCGAKYRAYNSYNLTDQYVATLLHLPTSQIPPELIELKRVQLKLYRLTNQL